MLEINVKYTIALNISYYPIDLLPVFQKYLIFSNYSNEAFNTVYEKDIDFVKNW